MSRRRADATPEPGPFLKWAGGKTQLLPRLAPFFPHAVPSYVEPFVGSGAVFFHLRANGRLSGRVLLADINPELIHAYRMVQQQVEPLIETLERLRADHGSEQYYAVREQPFTPDVAGAARTIYLNKTGYNGLYRLNSQGGFNVPMGRYKNPGIFDEAALRAASQALQGVTLAVQGFEATLAAAGEGDFLYLDPPYVPLSTTSSFTAYYRGGFSMEQQEQLAQCVRAARERGARFVLSNSYTNEVCRLYAGFTIEKVPARRSINSKASARGDVAEAVVLGGVPRAGE